MRLTTLRIGMLGGADELSAGVCSAEYLFCAPADGFLKNGGQRSREPSIHAETESGRKTRSRVNDRRRFCAHSFLPWVGFSFIHIRGERAVLKCGVFRS